MHINYCEQGQSLAEAARKAADWGFDGVEFRGVNTRRELSDDAYIGEVAEAVEGAGLSTVILGGPGPNFVAESADVRERELAAAIAFYEKAASRLDLGVCNILLGRVSNPAAAVGPKEAMKHGSYAAREEMWSWVVDRTKRLARAVGEHGITLASETHAGFLHDSLESSVRLVESVAEENFALTFDYGNMYRLSDTPDLPEVVSTLGERIAYLHVKNVLELSPGVLLPTALSQGVINNRELLRLVAAEGYDGPICIEAPRPGDRERFAVEDLAYAKELIAEL